jgi:hypothetical protein
MRAKQNGDNRRPRRTTSIKIFVIGIFGATDIGAGADSNLDKIALAGGADSAFILYTSDDVSSQLITALDKLRGTRLVVRVRRAVCQRQSEVRLRRGRHERDRERQNYVALVRRRRRQVRPITGGWYYNSDPATTDPSRIEICPVTCTSFQGAVGASLQIAVGCQTIVK